MNKIYVSKTLKALMGTIFLTSAVLLVLQTFHIVDFADFVHLMIFMAFGFSFFLGVYFFVPFEPFTHKRLSRKERREAKEKAWQEYREWQQRIAPYRREVDPSYIRGKRRNQFQNVQQPRNAVKHSRKKNY